VFTSAVCLLFISLFSLRSLLTVLFAYVSSVGWSHVCPSDIPLLLYSLLLFAPPLSRLLAPSRACVDLSASFATHVVSGLPSNKYLRRVRLGFESGLPESEWSWRRLRLLVEVRWPMSLLLTEEVVGGYQHVHCFLSSLKRCELRLGKAWSLLRNGLLSCLPSTISTSSAATGSVLLREGDSALPSTTAHHCSWSELAHHARLLCWQLLIFLRHLAFYAMEDVIEVLSRGLHQELGDLPTRSASQRSQFRAAFEVHQQFVRQVLHACFLHIPPVRRMLHSLFSVIERLCAWLESVHACSLVHLRLLDDPAVFLATLTQVGWVIGRCPACSRVRSSCCALVSSCFCVCFCTLHRVR
jgi:Gamma tubulin complex component C-terminal